MPPASPVAPKVRRLSLLIHGAAILFLGSVTLLYLGSWLVPDAAVFDGHWGRMARVGGLPLKAAGAFTGTDRFIVGAVCLPYLFCLAWAFFHLHRMLRGFERGEFFERATVGHLRAFAGLLLLAKALSLVANHVRVAMYSPLAPPGTRFAFSVTSDEVALLLMCALIFLIAHLMEEGDRLAEENRSFL